VSRRDAVVGKGTQAGRSLNAARSQRRGVDCFAVRDGGGLEAAEGSETKSQGRLRLVDSNRTSRAEKRRNSRFVDSKVPAKKG